MKLFRSSAKRAVHLLRYTHPSTRMASLFFYGTLLVPEILLRVINRPGQDLTFQPGILKGFSRHAVKGEDYPAMISEEESQYLTGSRESGRVRGTIVHHLTPSDIAALTRFEGDEYAIQTVSVTTLSEQPVKLKDHAAEFVLEEGLDKEGKIVSAETFIWTAGSHKLEAEAWDFQTFIADKLHLWTIPISSLPDNYDHPKPSPATMAESVLPANNDNPPQFGHGITKYFSFSPGYVNLNHGAYGAAPLPVLKYGEEITAACESKPDLFFKRDYIPLLKTARARVAEVIKAKPDDVVLTPNTSHAVNTVLNNIAWKENDIIVSYSTTYGSVNKALAFNVDRFPLLNLKSHAIPLTFPMSHAEIISLTESTIEKLNKEGPGNVRLVVIDAIVSMPAVVLPWREVAKVAKQHGALCLADGAHLIGQQPIDLSDPEVCDFFVSNCHKWLYAKRGLAVLWVPERNHRLIQSPFPTSAAYTSATDPGVNGPTPFHKLFDWTATNDLAPTLSVIAALDFRAWLGGEKVITDYCHSLAVEGGKILQKIWSEGDAQMKIMETEKGELTANMVNVELPLLKAPTMAGAVAQYEAILDSLFKANCFAMPYVHNDKWWVRASAQVYNEPKDFEYVAKVLKEHCDLLK